MNPMQPIADIQAAAPRLQAALTEAMVPIREVVQAFGLAAREASTALSTLITTWVARYRWGAYLSTGWTGKPARAQVMQTWRKATPRQRQRMLVKAVQG